MIKSCRAILIDTNVIIECHARGCWKALAGQYPLETVEQCVIETQTGHQHRRPELQINEVELRSQLRAVYPVTARELAKVIALGGSGLDEGERALWAHALQRSDVWILCGPDRASMKFGYDNKLRERLVSLGELLTAVNLHPALSKAYSKAWLDAAISKFALGIV